MKPSLRLSLVILLLIASFGGHAAGKDLASPDMERILKRGKLIVAMAKRDDYPFSLRTRRGDETGFDIDMARDIAARLGVRVEFNRSADTFDEVVDIVARREADLGISDLTATLERAKKVSFTMPYLKLNTYVLARRTRLKPYGHMSTREIVNNEGVRILVELGTSYVKFAREEFPLATLVPHGDVEQGLQEVLKGKAFGLFEGEAYVKSLFRERPHLYLYLENLLIEGREDRIAIAVPWESVHLLSWLNLYLKTDMPGTTIDAILDRYPRK